MEIPRDAESIRHVLEQAAAAAFQRAQAGMENMNLQDAQNVRRLLEHAATEAIARAQEFEIPMAAMHRPAEVVEGAFMGLWPILKRFLIFCTIGLSILLSSTGIYGLFYVSIQPGQAASEPLFFDYSGIAKHPVLPATCYSEAWVEDSCTQFSPIEELQGAPWAAVDFFSKHSRWEAYHYDVVPKPLSETKILKEGKHYFFEVVLELPESPLNRRTGMFMIHVDLQSSNGTRLASSMRAARLPHESTWISTIRKSIWLLPMVIGAAQETRTIVVPSFRHFRESATLPFRYATVSLVMQRKDKRRKDEPLEVTKGEIRIGKELTDFQFMLREYFFSCYMVGVMILSTIQLLGLIIIRSYWQHQRRQRILRQMQEVNDDPSQTLELDENQLEQERSEWDDLSQPTEMDADGTRVPRQATDEERLPEGPAPSTPSLQDEPSLEHDAPISENDLSITH